MRTRLIHLLAALLCCWLPACTADPAPDSGGAPPANRTLGALGDACDNEHPCGAELACEFKRCVGVTGARCAADTNCSQLYGLICRPGELNSDEQRCQPLGRAGEPCQDSSDCRMGGCGAGTGACANVAGSACNLDSDCLAPLKCRAELKTAQRKCLPPGAGNEFCDNEADCADGRPCENGFCQLKIDETGCLNDGACPAGHLCLPLGPDGKTRSCRPPAAVGGAYCATKDGCKAPMLCISNACLSPAEAPCQETPDCAAGNVCRGGECLAPGKSGESCADVSGKPQDDLCAAGLLCGKKLICHPAASLPEGEACARDAECGIHDSGVPMKCHAKLSLCALPGPVIANVAVSEVYSVKSPEDSWTPWQCFNFPEFMAPTGYKLWHYVDTLSHRSNGEDYAGYRVAYPGDNRACVSVWGAKNPILFGDKVPTELRFRLNTVAYNPSLMMITTHVTQSPKEYCDPSALWAGVDHPELQPCITEGTYAHEMRVPANFEGIGLVEPVAYKEEAGPYVSFVTAVASLKEVKAVVKDYIGIDVERYMLFATAANDLCSGWVGLRYHGVFWRSGLAARGKIIRNRVSQTMGGVDLSLLPPDLGITTFLTFLHVQSFNLDTKVIQDDRFWEYCGSFSDQKVTCQPEKPASNPLPTEIDDVLKKGAGDGASKLCKKFVPVDDICDWAGKGAQWVLKKLLDLIFKKACGSGVDKDGSWRLAKEDSGMDGGWNFSYIADTGEAKLNDDAAITAQIVELGFLE